MFSIVQRGSDWVLRAEGADVMVVGSKWIAKRIVREAAITAAKQRGPRAAERRAPHPLGRRAGDALGADCARVERRRG